MSELKHCHIMQLPPENRPRCAGILETGGNQRQRRSGGFLSHKDHRWANPQSNPSSQPGTQGRPWLLWDWTLKTDSDYRLWDQYGYFLERIHGWSGRKIKYLEHRTAELKELYEKEYKGKPSRPRVLITGCPTTGVIDKIVRQIEELGADVVGFENCCGPREKKIRLMRQRIQSLQSPKNIFV